MNVIKVSVLTPLYNHATEYVRKCLESLHMQTMRDIEFILINNGANEENKALIKEYLEKDSRFRALNFEKNQGYGKAMNTGLDSAQGEYIGIVESDDFIRPNMYEILYQNAIKKHTDIAKSLFSFWEDAKGITRKYVNTYDNDKYYKALRNDEITELPMFWAAQWAAIYKKSMLIANDILWSDIPGASHQDMGFMMKTWMAADKIVIVPEDLYLYRRDNDNSSTYKNNTVAWGDAKEYKLLKKWMEQHPNLMKDVYWAIYSRREYLNKSYFYSQMTRKKLKYYFFEMSLKFRKQIKEKRVNFNLFSKEEKIRYKKIAKHPLLYLFSSSLKSRILFEVNTPQKTEKKFCGITYFKKRINQNKTVYSYIINLFRIIDTHRTISYRFCGIPVITKKNTEQKQYIKLFGIPLYYKEDKQFEIKQQLKVLKHQVVETNKYLLEQRKVCNNLNQKLINMKCIIEAESLHKKLLVNIKMPLLEEMLYWFVQVRRLKIINQ